MKPKMQNQALEAAVEAAHLVGKMVLIGKHEQDRQDAEKWMEKYEHLLIAIKTQRSEKKGPWRER